ncbi:unnamed protein product [Paramecium pentaurelia]|uniref:Protein kinase domain-containing protein n=1 Tax=Paramecium pentaurelia TaxID=43138 RepID=A0A8S1X898_9CILI|nr:unnamed protein product [Paramecium pentaurelia]
MMYEEYDDSPLQFIKSIRIYLNGDSSKYLDLKIAQNSNWSDIQTQLDQKFTKFKEMRLFTQQGVEIFQDDVKFFKDGQSFYASRGDEFDPHSPFSQYETIKKLGEGGFGCVTLARHRITGEQVAIKVIKMMGNAQDIELNFREAEVLRSLSHKNIVKVFNSYALKNTQMAVIMEYLEGGELAERLRQKGRFQEEEACKYFRQIVSAIAYCHQKNIVHRDLKMENLLFCSPDSDDLKAIDFGIAGLQCPTNNDHVNIGSLHYMAPEILCGKVTRVSTSVDIWAMGIILYKMLFGKVPFNGKSQQDIVTSIINKDLTLPPNNFSEEVINLITQMLERNHEQRPRITDVEYHPWVNSDIRTPQQKQMLLQIPSDGNIRKSRPSLSPRPRSKSPNPSGIVKHPNIFKL